jgi:hypothetical protein
MSSGSDRLARPWGRTSEWWGNPLGNRLSLNQGKLIRRWRINGAPVMVMRMLGAEGASGAPYVDDAGRVLGVMQLGLSKSRDFMGQRTAGVQAGLDLVRWWGPRARLNLCRSYPNGGIAGCANSMPAASPPPRPAQRPPTTPTTSTPPAPPPSPAPAAWSPGGGFTIWTGAGNYRAGSVAVQTTSSCTPIYSTSARCWGVNVVSEYGCRNGAFVNVDLYDSNGTQVDKGIDQITVLGPSEVELVHGDTFQPSAVKFQITNVDCFNF